MLTGDRLDPDLSEQFKQIMVVDAASHGWSDAIKLMPLRGSLPPVRPSLLLAIVILIANLVISAADHVGPDGYAHASQACVNGENIILYTSKSVEECKGLCDAYGTGCMGFEYGVAHGGGGSGYSPGDCQLSSGTSTSGCDGAYANLDFYERVPWNSGYIFTGSASSYLTATPRTPTIGGTSGLTISAWVSRSTSTTTSGWANTWDRLIDFGSGGHGSNIILSFAAGTTYHAYHGSSSDGIQVDTPFPVSVWTHVALVASQNGSTSYGPASIYWDGVLKASTTSMRFPQDVTRSGYYVGKSHWADPMFQGEMRDLLIWDFALSASQLDDVRLGNLLPASAAPLVEMMRSSCDVSPSLPPLLPPSAPLPPLLPPSAPPPPPPPTLNVVTNLAGSGTAGFVDNIGAAAQFNAPCQVALSPDGATLFVADRYNHRIRAVATATNIVSTLAGSGSAGFSDATGTSASFNQPTGVTASPDGTTLFVGDLENHRIRSVTIATGAVATLAGSGSATAVDGTGAAASFNGPTGVTISPDGATVFVAEYASHRIRLIVVATGAVSTLAGGTQGFTDGTGGSARFDNPNGVVVSPDGEMCMTTHVMVHMSVQRPPCCTCTHHLQINRLTPFNLVARSDTQRSLAL